MNLAAAQQAARLLAERPEHDWRLDELAALVHLSVSQLGRVFSRRFGRTPMRFLMYLRAHLLATLLRETDLPIAEAMHKVGWHSRGHAARHFKAVFGMSPSSYREIGLNDQSQHVNAPSLKLVEPTRERSERLSRLNQLRGGMASTRPRLREDPPFDPRNFPPWEVKWEVVGSRLRPRPPAFRGRT